MLEPTGDRSVEAGSPLSFTVTASDPDGDVLTYAATGLPAGSAFDNGAFTWTPGQDQMGVCEVTFAVSDGALEDSQTIHISAR